jgi:hypothetical protein
MGQRVAQLHDRYMTTTTMMMMMMMATPVPVACNDVLLLHTQKSYPAAFQNLNFFKQI